MPSFDTSKIGTVEQDIIYASVGGQDLKLDMYYPSAAGPWPGLIFVHGGGWSEGDKVPLPPLPNSAGYLIASINYRMYPAYRFPTMIEDVKCAIRYLRAHAPQYNLDPYRIALIGHSAGGHLVALAGLAGPDAGWDVDFYMDQSSRVQAVIEMSGPADFRNDFVVALSERIANVFGPEQIISSSPVTYVHKDAPPFLIIHGDKDDLVPVREAICLHEAIIQAGGHSELLIIQNGGHGFEPIGGEVAPSLEEILKQIVAFLDRNMGTAKG